MYLWLDLGEYSGPGLFHAFLMYAAGRAKVRADDMAYRTYVTDSLRAIPRGEYLTRRFADLFRTCEEIDADAIIDSVISALEGGE